MLAILMGFVALGFAEGFLSGIATKEATKVAKRYAFGTILIERHGAYTSTAREDPYRYALSPDDQRFIEDFLTAHASAVTAFTRKLLFRGTASTGKSSVLIEGSAQDPRGVALVRQDWAWNATAGRPLRDLSPNSVLLARTLGLALDCTTPVGRVPIGSTGAPIAEERPFTCRRQRVQISASTERGQVNVIEPEIGGLYEFGIPFLDAKVIELPLALAQKLLDTKAVTMYAVLLARPHEAAAFTAALMDAARARHLDIEAQTWVQHPSFGDYYRRSIELLHIYRNLVLIVVIVIAGMSVFATLLRAVAERTREIGTLRSLGFLRRHIVILFALEAAVLAAVATLGGLAATLALRALIEQSGITYSSGIYAEPVRMHIDFVPEAYAVAGLVLIGVAVLAALGPATRAARLAIPEALAQN